MMLTVLVPKVSPRLTYVLRVLLTGLLQVDFRLVLPEDAPDHVDIAYGLAHPGALVSIPKGHNLLFEEGLVPVPDSFFGKEGKRWGIRASNQIDWLASAFWLLSYYEGYFIKERDEYGRIPAHASLLFKEGVLHRPLVEEYAMDLRNELTAAGIQGLEKPVFSFLPTFDIDQAYAHKHKNPFRLLLGTGKQLLGLRFGEFATRMGVLLGNKPDPFDTFAWIHKSLEPLQCKPIFFLPCGRYGSNDRHNSPSSKGIQKLYRNLGKKGDVGLHPSFASADRPEQIKEEKQRLETIMDSPVSICRQHYLRLMFPQSYSAFAMAGFTDDYSMAYPDAPGYRTGMSRPYPWFDVEKNEEIALRVHPFALMEHTFERYIHLSENDVLKAIDDVIAATKQVGGLLTTTFHNHTLKEGEQARKLYRYILEKASSGD